jgi:quinohemoprotein amine dehydrogenase beta subunit
MRHHIASSLRAGLLGLALLPLVITGCAQPQRDFMAVANRPNQVSLIDLEERKLVRTCPLPGRFGAGTLQMSPDKRTAFVLSNHFENIYGVNLDTCAITFSAIQSEGNTRIKTTAGFAVSPDGTELYVHQNPSLLLRDRYEVQEPRVAVYRIADGLQAKPVRSFPAPRQVILLQTDAKGTLYLAGRDIYSMDVKTGAYDVKLESQSRKEPRYGQRDVLSIWPLGQQSGEFIRMYTVQRYADETKKPETAEYMWGYERIDLATGEASTRDFGPLNVVLFSGMTRPHHPNEMFGALSQLQKFDVEKQTLVKSVDLEHSYYCVNFSSDGSRVYLAGTFNDIAIYDAETLEKLGNIQLPGGDQSLATAQVFPRAP